MGKKSDFSQIEKVKLRCWLQENVKTAEMAKRLGRHPGAVRKQLARIRLLSPEDSDDLLKTEA